MTARRTHRWKLVYQDQHKTERQCIRCNMVRVTKHPPVGFPWIEYWRGLDRLPGDKTPPCEPIAETVTA